MTVLSQREITERIDNVTEVATSPGNAHADHYLRGMANGLILAQSIAHNKSPVYIEADVVPPPFDYMAEADKTCSVVFHPDYIDKGEFVNLLHSFASLAEAINLRKKLFFRGKTPADVGLYHPNRAASLAVEFDPNNTDAEDLNMLHGIVGIVTEAGEMAEVLIRRIETGKFDEVNVCEEAGDVLWYLARLGRGLNITLDQIGTININKLRGRHGETFDVFRDANRNLMTERARLERDTMHRDAELFEMSARLDDANPGKVEFPEVGTEELEAALERRRAAYEQVPVDRVTYDPARPCIGTDIHHTPEPGALWEDGCWRKAFNRDIPGLA